MPIRTAFAGLTGLAFLAFHAAACATTLVAAVADAFAHPAPRAAVREPGALLRAGTWDGGVGTYFVPSAFEHLAPTQWPTDGWHRIVLNGHRLRIAPVSAAPGRVPAFLQTITAQVAAGDAGTPASEAAPAEDAMYVRFPGVTLRTGDVPAYRFMNGTASLVPKLDHRYELELGGRPFAFTVQNGLRTRAGTPYGEGAQYAIEVDGVRYEYSLPGFGWDSRVNAIADLDGDGRPDFIIGVGGNNSGHEYVLLSSLARPGRNAPSASLHSIGC